MAYGWSSLAILLALGDKAERRLHSIDLPYLQRDNDPWVGCAVPEHLRSRWTLYRGSDRMWLDKALRATRGSLRVAHYDSDKTYHGRMWAYPRIWDALLAGGCFISDDIQDNLAFRDFAQSVSQEPVVVATEGKYVGALLKP